ncbi:nucleotide sugar dehydrogenase [Aquihabitans sp. G128]|uniref:nucleotide sugar dehydrogenase n=1 Tax=Aquihabitans sp. G128 TaxID=2849779 RepID=UPI001C224DDF|nr:nucleotide sugar dehydrogenase [Aquihabitans sp. G128]QXC61329.1 nucleotide sugar dehydrogenase [Aquihabitans sp. G128]
MSTAAGAPDRVIIVGQGYVGLPLAVRAVEQGHDVVGFDLDRGRIEQLAAGDSYIEDIPDERLAACLATGRYLPSSDPDDLAAFDIAVISVPTPLKEGSPDLSYIEASAAELGRRLTKGACVILESTTYPGTTEELVAPLLEQASGLKAGEDFQLGYSPERIDPGNATWTLETTPKVVSGIDAASLARVKGFYDTIVERTVPTRSPKEAELTKLLENTFRHVNIALVNELTMFARDLGIDVWEAIDAAESKPFGFMPFRPGPGVGGHCLPIDPSYLSWRVKQSLGLTFRFVELANEVNEHMPDYVVRRLVSALNDQERSMKGSRILVAGVAYKRNTGDDRESPSGRVIELLTEQHADVVVCDPHVDPERSHATSGATWVELTADEVRKADVVLILVDHDAFDLQLIEAEAKYVLDTRRCTSGTNVEHL